MPNCLVWCCDNRRGKDRDVNYYTLTPERKEPWLRALGIDPQARSFSSTNTVCSEHFAAEDLMLFRGRPVPKKGVLPTQKLHMRDLVGVKRISLESTKAGIKVVKLNEMETSLPKLRSLLIPPTTTAPATVSPVITPLLSISASQTTFGSSDPGANEVKHQVSYGMSKKCSVQGCPESNGNLLRFPKPRNNMMIFVKWLYLCQNKELFEKSPQKVYLTNGVCRLHFDREDYTNTRLLRTAFPHLNLPDVQTIHCQAIELQ